MIQEDLFVHICLDNLASEETTWLQQSSGRSIQHCKR